MKFLGLLCLLVIGCASAEFRDALDGASDSVLERFVQGMERTPSFKEIVGLNYDDQLERIEEDVKNHLGKTLKRSLNDIISRIRESMDQGREVATHLIEKVKEIGEILKGEVGGVTKELLERLKEKARYLIEKVLATKNHIQQVLDELKFENVVENLKNHLLENLDVEDIKSYIRSVFGDLSKTGAALLEHLREQGLGAVRDLLTLILPRRLEEAKELEVKVIGHTTIEKRWIIIAKAACMLIKFMANGWTKSKLQGWIDNNVEPKWHGTLSTALKYGLPALRFVLGRFCYAAAPGGPTALVEAKQNSLLELWQRIREALGKFGQEVQERVFLFADWIKEVVHNGISDLRTRVETLKQAAKQVIDNGWTAGKEVAEEFLKTMQPYKENLGVLWQQLVDALQIKA